MHHANLIVGSATWGMSHVPEGDRDPCADVIVYQSPRFSIDDVRTLAYEAGLRPVTRAYRTFIIQTESLLPPAQNALLKLFEEPNAHSVFYLIVPEADTLLPTLRSRLSHIATERTSSESDVFQKFLKLSHMDRLEYVATLVKQEDDAWLRPFVAALSHHAHQSKNPECMRDALFVERHIFAPGASKKMLLEHVALSV